jgi:hypothetical protein
MARTLKSKRKRAPNTILKLPDLEQSKSAVVNSLTSPSCRRSVLPLLQRNSISDNQPAIDDGFVESQPLLRAVPVNELANRMVVGALR